MMLKPMGFLKKAAAGGAFAWYDRTPANFGDSTTSTASPSITVDLSAFGTDDQVVVMRGGQQYATACTVGGSSATKISNDTGAGYEARINAFRYTMTGAGSASTSIVMTLPSAAAIHDWAVFVIENGTYVGYSAQATATGAQLSNTLTPTKTTNVFLTFSVGRDSAFDGGGMVFTRSGGAPNPTRIANINTANFGYSGAASAYLENRPASAQTILGTADVQDDLLVMQTVLYESL